MPVLLSTKKYLHGKIILSGERPWWENMVRGRRDNCAYWSCQLVVCRRICRGAWQDCKEDKDQVFLPAASRWTHHAASENLHLYHSALGEVNLAKLVLRLGNLFNLLQIITSPSSWCFSFTEALLLLCPPPPLVLWTSKPTAKQPTASRVPVTLKLGGAWKMLLLTRTGISSFLRKRLSPKARPTAPTFPWGTNLWEGN